ncbi:MAG: MFS transporter, partial [Deltaproteobacteria bacterium]|nr:MFS transporter [Deltaproteobacteria bacterium]
MSAHVSFSSMAQVLIRRRLFRRLWLSDVVSHLGDWLSMVALAVLITREAQSGVALGILFTIHTLPHVFSA